LYALVSTAYAGTLFVNIGKQCTINFKTPLVPGCKAPWGGSVPARCFGDINTGRTVLRGIPFTIVNPGSNRNRSMVAVSAHRDKKYPDHAVLPVHKKGRTLYFLHSALKTWYGSTLGGYSVEYQDGSSVTIPLVVGQAIYDWDTPRENRTTRIGHLNFDPGKSGLIYGGYYQVGNLQKGSYIFEWKNPCPEKVIKQITLKAQDPQAVILLWAITLSAQGPVFNAAETKGLTEQIYLPEPIGVTRNGRCTYRVRLTDRNGRAVNGARVKAHVGRRAIIMPGSGRGEYAADISRPHQATQPAGYITVRAEKQGYHFYPAKGIIYTGVST
jgi:hypothetical protein